MIKYPKPLVSICIPTYKQPELFTRCIDSVFAQTYQNYEIIISDDSPDDSIKEIVDSHAARRKIRYFKNTPALGVPKNWNRAMDYAEGDLINLLHHDDWYFNGETLARLVEAVDANSCIMSFARSFNINDQGVVEWINDPDDIVIKRVVSQPERLIYVNIIGHPSAVLFKKVSMRFDEQLSWLVDLDFYIRLLGKGRGCYTKTAIMGIGLGPNQLTNSRYGVLESELGENLVVYKKIYRRFCFIFKDYRHFSSLFRKFSVSFKELALFHPGILIVIFYRIFKIQRFFERARTWIYVRMHNMS